LSEVVRTLVYLLCFATAAACAFLLWRSYVRTKVRLLLWSGLCFGFLAANALAVIFDILIIHWMSLQMLRLGLSFAAVGVLLYGLIWDMED
jgi:predicted ABC-type exoprotein transport system permease subunit